MEIRVLVQSHSSFGLLDGPIIQFQEPSEVDIAAPIMEIVDDL